MSRLAAIGSWLKRHKLDVAAMLVLAGVTAAVSMTNMANYPQRFEDEGTYISQAWAIEEKGQLTHYTYWYDHPPLGWIQIAAYLMVTQGFERYDSAISAGREFMVILHTFSVVLLYALARRLGLGVVASAIGGLLYALSPLSIEFSRYVLLDNVAMPWLLAAFVLALSPRRSLLAAVGSAVCMAFAILSKETFLALLPVLIYALWRSGDPRNRRYTLTAFGVVFMMISATYVLYAVLKNELLPGQGHVSLIGTFIWQIFGRAGTGSIFQEGTQAHGLVGYWLVRDFWLLAFGLVSLIPALIYKNLRPVGLALLIGLLLTLREGYLPYPHIITLLPFAALCFAGLLDKLVFKPLTHNKFVHGHFGRQVAACAVVAVVAVTSAVFVAPMWQSRIQALTQADIDSSSRQAVDWISDNVPRSSRLVVESALWSDLEGSGFTQPNPVWLYKTETDPAVTSSLGGWQGIDYIILNGPTIGGNGFNDTFPTVSEAMKNSEIVTEFGTGREKILVFKVKHQ